MLWAGHIILNRIVTGTWSFWSVAPDFPMALLLLSQNPWEERFAYDVFYKVPHSFLFLFILKGTSRYMWGLHLLLDIPSHTGIFSMEPLYPIKWKIQGLWDAYPW